MRQAYDSRRDRWLAENGYKVLRFTNDDCMSNIEGVAIEVERTLALLPSPNPSRKREGDA